MATRTDQSQNVHTASATSFDHPGSHKVKFRRGKKNKRIESKNKRQCNGRPQAPQPSPEAFCLDRLNFPRKRLSIAQLVERRTVEVILLSLGHWFESGSGDQHF